jgi:predicted Zn-dependent protease
MKKLHALFFSFLVLSGCTRNPLTGKNTMAFISNDTLFQMSIAQYDEFLNENEVVTGTPEAEMVERVGQRIAAAARKWLEAREEPHYLDNYKWDFKLVNDDSINAWAMPGGKIVFYTGILPVTLNEDGLAVVMGHEIAHALLNHGQQRMSADIIRQLGAIGISIAVNSQSAGVRDLIMTAFGVGSSLFGTLPFSREHENEADLYGLKLMTIAGYNPEEAASFWDRMSALDGGNVPQFLSTHPSSPNRASQLRDWVPDAKQVANQLKE